MESISLSYSSIFSFIIFATIINSQIILGKSNIEISKNNKFNSDSDSQQQQQQRLNQNDKNNQQFKDFINYDNNMNNNENSENNNNNNNNNINSNNNHNRANINDKMEFDLHMDDFNNDLTSKSSTKPHKRSKRLIWVTDDGRLALPPGTVLSISPTISLPLVRYPPEGFLSNLTMSFPLTIDFDKLGLTDNQNPLGVLPPVFARSMGRAAGSVLANYIGDYLQSRRKTRSIFDNYSDNSNGDDNNKKNKPTNHNFDPLKLAENHRHIFHGGERAILYGVIEDLITTFGYNGRACLLRAICEVHSKKLTKLGLFGEMVKLFFTATKSEFAELLTEYVSAEEMGGGKIGPGECFPYYKECPLSIFKNGKNHYNEVPVGDQHTDDDDSMDHEDDDEELLHSTNNVLNLNTSINDLNGNHLNM